MLDVTLLGEVFVTLFVIMDPPGVIPLFLSLTGGRAPAVRRRVAWQAALVAFLVITLFALFGQQILNYLHITLAALRVSGGLLLLLVALELLTGKADEVSPTVDVNVALVPLGTPLLAGPGAIVATMVFVQQTGGAAPRLLAVALGIVGVHVALWLTMRYSVVILRIIKDSGVLLITRVSGLLLSAIAVQLVADGLRDYISGG
ncbi:MAG: MarC family protein [Actinomycetota bacterium]|nr:MarC family protein [Actinomycetota bacterium]